MSENQQFKVDLRAAVEAMKDNAEGIVIAFFLDLFGRVIIKTRQFGLIDTGFYLNSWWAVIGQPGQRPEDIPVGAPPSDAGQGDSGSRVSVVVTGYRLGRPLIIANGAAYGARLEFGFDGQDELGRSYSQRPRPAVRAALRQSQLVADQTTARLGGGS